MKKRIVCILFMLSMCSVFGIRDDSNQERWEQPAEAGLDAEVPGFLINLGPTGIRAILQEKSFVVKYVFKNSPAEGRINLNDVIIGVNGKEFSPHIFGGDKNLGIDGPIFDFGMGIEESEGGNGILKIMVKRGNTPMNIPVQLEKLGKFSATFPENCAKTKILHKRALDYLATNPKMSIDGRCPSILALISSDDKSHQAAGKEMIQGLNSIPRDGTWTWHLSFRSIALAEYYILTQDSSVLDALKGTLARLREAQYKGDEIIIPRLEEEQDKEKIEIYRKLFEGGFGHAPYRKTGPGNYGPMQFQTILAVISWQLGQECGIPVKHDGIEKALQYMALGTNSAGSVAYGLSFGTFGMPDRNRFRNGQNRRDPQKSGLSILAYNLTPEYEKSESYVALHRENLSHTFRGMQNGHADGIMAMSWGMLGVGASGDEKLKREIFDYFKIWLNMTRCHGSNNYVALPGRDAADAAYYRDKGRAHVTAMAALVYSFMNPKLQVHGVKIAIPGVNHKALNSQLKTAYSSMLDGKFGHSAGIISKSGSPGGDVEKKMLDFLNAKAKKEISVVSKPLEMGQWLTVNKTLSEMEPHWAGVPYFDQKYNHFKSLLADPGGPKLLNADTEWQNKHFANALKLAMSALKTAGENQVKNTSGRVIARINFKAYEYEKILKKLEVQGEWYTLFLELKNLSKAWSGIKRIDDLSKKLAAPFNTNTGKALASTHKFYLDGNFSKAYKMTLAVKSKGTVERHKKLAGVLEKKIIKSVSDKVKELNGIRTSGAWYTLYIELNRIKNFYSGVKEFDDFYSRSMSSIKSSGGKILSSTEKLLQGQKYSLASKSLNNLIVSQTTQEIKDIGKVVLDSIDTIIEPEISRMVKFEQEEDWYKFKQQFDKMKYNLSGIKSFDDKRAVWDEKLRDPVIVEIINAGKDFISLKKSWARGKTNARKKKLANFAEENKDNIYGKKAESLLTD